MEVLDIIKATYGPADISDKLLTKYKAGDRTFYPKNDTWGDPEEGAVKTLTIKYKHGDETFEKTAQEHTSESITLPNGVLKSDAS
jgi:hypothetical protein